MPRALYSKHITRTRPLIPRKCSVSAPFQTWEHWGSAKINCWLQMTLVPRAINSAHLATGMRGRYHPGGDGSDLDEGRRQARAHREDGVLGQEAGWRSIYRAAGGVSLTSCQEGPSPALSEFPTQEKPHSKTHLFRMPCWVLFRMPCF